MRIPTIKELQSSINSDLKNQLDLSDDNLKKVADAMSIVLSAQLKLLYLNLSDVQDNIFPDKADTSENGGTLDRLGNIWLNRNRNPATQGNIKLKVI